MRRHCPAALAVALSFGTASAVMADGQAAMQAFNAYCFQAGQTSMQARANMQALAGTPLPFTLVFWDATLEKAPADAPRGVERRCEVSWPGDQPRTAIDALRAQMATPPVFGQPTALPDTHAAQAGTALIEGRELLQGRVAVVHVGTRAQGAATRTFMAVDRLPVSIAPGDSK
ncbi:hypothetical protein [Pseudosulfitobacter koreensis]|uniref:Uncharacterized protein n=1 Tax=Pseudosulfitobacter koreensis TaxID=2968472 RepID=A0ABT1Z2P3_9RHOB|nr:hypothetical protein [Pseudosulfitobacter koreense]MCR8827403.1 hypothetical protein [Pseudosulfitobacter koreense]